jgi:tetratricopeptide (TPR) repeat protein
MPESVISAQSQARNSRLGGRAGWSTAQRGAGRSAAVFVLLWLAAGSLTAWGHPDLDEQIVELTVRIKKEPANAELLLRRSEVHRWHGEFELAFADIDAAARLQPSWAKVSLARALTFNDAGQGKEAMAAVQEFLKHEPAHADGLVLRARCHVKLGQPANAVADYSAALKAFAEPSPDLFVERARLQASLGRLGEAVKGLDEGQARLGSVAALQRLAIDYERQQGDFNEALKRVERLMAKAPVKEPGLVLRAEVLEQAGRLTEAREVYRRLLASRVDSASGRFEEATFSVKQRARDGLARVEGKLARMSAEVEAPSRASLTEHKP